VKDGGATDSTVGGTKVEVGGMWTPAGGIDTKPVMRTWDVVSAMMGLSLPTPADTVDTLSPVTAGATATLFVGSPPANNRRRHTQPNTYSISLLCWSDSTLGRDPRRIFMAALCNRGGHYIFAL